MLPADALISKTASFVCLHEALALRATSARVHVAASAATRQHGSFLFVCGGCCGQRSRSPNCMRMLSCAEKFDAQSGCWERVPDMTEARGCAAAVVLGCRLYVIGGSNGLEALASVERFDSELCCWERLPPMADCRVWPSAGAINGTIYVCAGTDGMYVPHRYVRSVQGFHAESGTWRDLPQMLQGRRSAASAVLLGCLYVCGGSDGKLPLSSVERFDPASWHRKWRALPPMPSGRRHAACCVVGDATLLVIGGEDTSASMTSGLAFDAKTGSWTTLQPQIQLGRWWALALAVAGQPYICGGTDGARALASAEKLIEDEEQWEPASSMLQARCSAVGGVIRGRDLSIW